MSRKVVGLIGLKGCGKDTAAQALLNHGWKRIAYADALYIEVAMAFGVSVEFLQNRDTKETPLPELALVNCQQQLFVLVMLAVAEAEAKAKGLAVSMGEGLTVPRSPRRILQVWGTEFRRRLYGDDYWRVQVATAIHADPSTNYVITDVRFPDEAELITSKFGGELWRIRRPGLPVTEELSNLHPSELLMQNYPTPREFVNQEGDEGRASFLGDVSRVYH